MQTQRFEFGDSLKVTIKFQHNTNFYYNNNKDYSEGKNYINDILVSNAQHGPYGNISNGGIVNIVEIVIGKEIAIKLKCPEEKTEIWYFKSRLDEENVKFPEPIERVLNKYIEVAKGSKKTKYLFDNV